ncbi:6,7-dimethyl-8-ribityllumazine synthase [Candidatus Poribacteria bacterium]|nr:6,7-dimethyl-8-ribityllumazine synthase [Candidatus Poribacteria bacterium]
MPKFYEGNLIGSGLEFAILVSRFNSFITEKLLEGALDTLKLHGVALDDVSVFRTPGSYEIPATAKRLADTGKFNAIICLGAVIRGETPHFDYVAGESASGISQVSYATGIPTIFGVITTDTVNQAIERAGIKTGNKGSEAATAAIEVINLYKQIDQL